MSEIPAFFSKLQKTCSSAIIAYQAKSTVSKLLYTGDPSLQYITGGWSESKVTILYGPAGAGKSAIACHAAGLAQQKKPNGWVIIYDSEYYFDDRPDRIERLTKFGINLEKTMIISSKSIQESFGNIIDLYDEIKEGIAKKNKKTAENGKEETIFEIAAIIVDSWKGFENIAAVRKIVAGKVDEAGESHRGNAKTMNPILDQLVKITAVAKCLTFITSHVAQNQTQYGADFLLPGGENFRHQADAIIFLETVNASDAKLSEGDVQIAKSDYETEKVGKRIRAKAEKTRNTVEGKKCEFWYNFVDCHFALLESSLAETAEKIGLLGHPLNEKGAEVVAYWIFPTNNVTEQKKFHGKEAFLDALKNKEYFNEVMSLCFNKELPKPLKTVKTKQKAS